MRFYSKQKNLVKNVAISFVNRVINIKVGDFRS